MRRAGILGRCLWVTRSNHHVTVIPITPPALTTVCNITGHMALGKLIKLSSHNRTGTGLARPAGPRSC